MRIKALVNKDVPVEFNFFYFCIQDSNPKSCHSSASNRLEDFGKVDQANALAHAATQASDKMANVNTCSDCSKVFSHLCVTQKV